VLVAVTVHRLRKLGTFFRETGAPLSHRVFAAFDIGFDLGGEGFELGTELIVDSALFQIVLTDAHAFKLNAGMRNENMAESYSGVQESAECVT